MSAKPLVLYVMLAATALGAVAQGQVEGQDQGQPPGSESQKEWADIEKIFTREEMKELDEAEAKQELQKATTQQSEERGNALADFRRGAGLGITIAPDSSDRIDEASVVNDRILVTKENTNAARMMFEFHQLFTTNILTKGGRDAAREQILACEANAINCPMFGIGPFIALQMSEDDAIASVGAGLMIGVRNDPRKDTSFNIGIGVQWDSNAKELATGFVEGGALPEGETEIRFKEKGRARLMIGLSLGF